jgi:hypothetical protein
MVDFLITLAQGLCIGGLLYGAYLSITYSEADYPKKRARLDQRRERQTPVASTRPKSESESEARSEERRHVRA